MDAAGPAVRLVGTHDKTAQPDHSRAAVWEMERMPTVRDIEIVGESDESDGIELEGTMQATITGVLIRRCRYGIHLVKRNRNLLLANSHIYHGRGPAIGVFFDGVNLHQTNIVGCHISYCPHAGIKIESSEVRNLRITGCDIEYNFDRDNPDSADVWIDSRKGTVREGTIASNTIQANYSAGGANVRIEGLETELSNKAGLWTITGNVIMSQTVNLLLCSCRGVVVTGNTFASAADQSIVLDKCRHVVVGANTFDHNPDYTGDRTDGITVRNCAGCSLSNMILEGTRAGRTRVVPFRYTTLALFRSTTVLSWTQLIVASTWQREQLTRQRLHRAGPWFLAHDERSDQTVRVQPGHLMQGNLVSRGTKGDLVIQGGTIVTENVIANVSDESIRN